MGSKERCKTKYPILLVHGAGHEDQFPVNYWGRIPETLQREGARVYRAETTPWGTIEENSALLQGRIQDILYQEKVDKVNIIAHSRGGLEARRVAAEEKKLSIASITTICTPHRGLKAADYYRGKRRMDFYSFVLAGLWKIFRKREVYLKTGLEQLAPEFLKEFNKTYLDREGVYYQSYGGSIGNYCSGILYYLLYKVTSRLEPESDGLVSMESAKWTNYRGTLKNCSHQYVTDTFKKDNGGVIMPEFYTEIVEELKEIGL